MTDKNKKNPPVEVHDLTVAYDQKPVLWDIDFELPEGKITAVIGPNGAGKSTLIKAMMGLIPSSSGYTLIYGKPLDKQRKNVAYVPQRESVDWNFPINVMDVVLMGRYPHLRLFQRPSRRDRELAVEALQEVGMQDYRNRQISQLSGGQQQRVFLARALSQDASIYLMDEPLAGVDAATEDVIFDKLRDLRAQNKTVVVVHHDLQSVPENFDWAMLLNLRMVALGPVDSTFTDENLQKTYGGRLNILSQMVEQSRQQRFLREQED
ncbi:metal ABC transporter ATP-binding protein [Natronogracilivirga saccharolytica]|uniref:Metal ABC transporter ATP-binding protein n=1 Tax=Natronogracilivirga saccharolytica TaxID=2812953 RepID=A0A8J7RK43_9BACT|nr:metal ABC transporter ATP-binding protein [Natronogracilivirga saccharolytica]MBP3193195.1 metal ABC transporter ATP-binding protein [Natronogracilivirga saccharolytica]